MLCAGQLADMPQCRIEMRGRCGGCLLRMEGTHQQMQLQDQSNTETFCSLFVSPF